MNIGPPQRVLEIEPASLPIPEVLPEPEPAAEPQPAETQPAEPAR